MCNITAAKDVIVDITPSRTECRVACPICPGVFLLSKSNDSYTIWNFKRHYTSAHLNLTNNALAVPEDIEMVDAGAGTAHNCGDSGAATVAEDIERKLLEMTASNNALQAKYDAALGQIEAAHGQIIAITSEMDGMRAIMVVKGRFSLEIQLFFSVLWSKVMSNIVNDIIYCDNF